jgi:uracil-DNA glycosylase
LWGFDGEKVKDEFINKWWDGRKKNYDRIYSKLNITKDIALNAYVTDAKRVANKNIDDGNGVNKKRPRINRDLVHNEIELLRPKMVICIGNTAKNVVGKKFVLKNEGGIRFYYVPFPNNYFSKEQWKNADEKYAGLNEALLNTLK